MKSVYSLCYCGVHCPKLFLGYGRDEILSILELLAVISFHYDYCNDAKMQNVNGFLLITSRRTVQLQMTCNGEEGRGPETEYSR